MSSDNEGDKALETWATAQDSSPDHRLAFAMTDASARASDPFLVIDPVQSVRVRLAPKAYTIKLPPGHGEQ